jgi:flagellar hook-basal body complex protein FliE
MSTLKEALGQVEGLQAEADQQVAALIEGNGQDVHSAMIAVERADLSFQLMMQVRNKIVSAYQEIARMQF